MAHYILDEILESLGGRYPTLRSQAREMSKSEKIETLKDFYLRFLVEDGRDGSSFDIEVLNALKALG